MRKHKTWRGMYLLGVLGADALAPLSSRGHDIATVGIILLVSALTFLWTESHASLVEAEGIDARAAEDQAHRMRFIGGGVVFVLRQMDAPRALTDVNERHELAPGNVVYYDVETVQRCNDCVESESRTRQALA
jgi:hypothetical protein